VAAGGPAPQGKILKHRALKRAPNQFPFIQSPFLNQRSLFSNGVTPSKCELSWEHKQKKFTSASAARYFRKATSEESRKLCKNYYLKQLAIFRSAALQSSLVNCRPAKPQILVFEGVSVW
jgi:hypothetical protein